MRERLETDIEIYKAGIKEVNHKRDKNPPDRHGPNGEELYQEYERNSKFNGYKQAEGRVYKIEEVYRKATADNKRWDLPKPDEFKRDMEEQREFRVKLQSGHTTDPVEFYKKDKDGKDVLVKGTVMDKQNAFMERRYAAQIEAMRYAVKNGSTLTPQQMLQENAKLVTAMGVDGITAGALFITNEKQLERAVANYRNADGSIVNLQEELGIPSPTVSKAFENAILSDKLQFDPERKGKEVKIDFFQGDPFVREKTDELIKDLKQYGIEEGKQFTRVGNSLMFDKDKVLPYLDAKTAEQLKTGKPVEEIKGTSTIAGLRAMAERVKAAGGKTPEVRKLMQQLASVSEGETPEMSDTKRAIFLDLGERFAGRGPDGARSFMSVSETEERNAKALTDLGIDSEGKKIWAEMLGVKSEFRWIEQDVGAGYYSVGGADQWQKRAEAWAKTPASDDVAKRASYLMPVSYSQDAKPDSSTKVRKSTTTYPGESMLKTAGTDKTMEEAFKTAGLKLVSKSKDGVTSFVLRPTDDASKQITYTLVAAYDKNMDSYKLTEIKATAFDYSSAYSGPGKDYPVMTLPVTDDIRFKAGSAQNIAGIVALMNSPRVQGSLSQMIQNVRNDLPQVMEKYGIPAGTIDPASIRADLLPRANGGSNIDVRNDETTGQKPFRKITFTAKEGGKDVTKTINYSGEPDPKEITYQILAQVDPKAALKYQLEQSGMKDVKLGSQEEIVAGQKVTTDFVEMRFERSNSVLLYADGTNISARHAAPEVLTYRVKGKWEGKVFRTTDIEYKNAKGEYVPLEMLTEAQVKDMEKNRGRLQLGFDENGKYGTENPNIVVGNGIRSNNTLQNLVEAAVREDSEMRSIRDMEARRVVKTASEKRIESVRSFGPMKSVEKDGKLIVRTVIKISSPGVGSQQTADYVLEKAIDLKAMANMTDAQKKEFIRKAPLTAVRQLMEDKSKPGTTIEVPGRTIDLTKGKFDLKELAKRSGKLELAAKVTEFTVDEDSSGTLTTEINLGKNGTSTQALDNAAQLFAVLNDNGYDTFKDLPANMEIELNPNKPPQFVPNQPGQPGTPGAPVVPPEPENPNAPEENPTLLLEGPMMQNGPLSIQSVIINVANKDTGQFERKEFELTGMRGPTGIDVTELKIKGQNGAGDEVIKFPPRQPLRVSLMPGGNGGKVLRQAMLRQGQAQGLPPEGAVRPDAPMPPSPPAAPDAEQPDGTNVPPVTAPAPAQLLMPGLKGVSTDAKLAEPDARMKAAIAAAKAGAAGSVASSGTNANLPTKQHSTPDQHGH